MPTFRSKVLIFTVALLIICQLATLAAVLDAASRGVNRQATERLQNGTKVFDRLLEDRATLLAQKALNLASETSFIDAVVSGDAATVSMVLKKHATEAEAQAAMLLNLNGEILAASSELPLHDIDLLPYLEERSSSESPRSFIVNGSQSIELYTMPIMAGTTVAWVALGYHVNDNLANYLADMTGLDVTILAKAKQGFDIAGSSLPDDTRSMMVAANNRIDSGTEHTSAVATLEDDFLQSRRPFVAGKENLFAIVQQSLQNAMAPYLALRTTIVHLVGMTFCGALLCAVMLSRTVTSPMSTLLQAARRMKVGNYGKKVEVKSRDEFGELAKAINSMQEGIAEREQRIIYQAQNDSLTGLPNRLHAMDLLRKSLLQCARGKQELVVMVMHLERFREIQSSLGHEIGDEVLRQTAERMRALLADEDILARLEGDQFLFLMPNKGRDDARETAKSLIQMLDTGLSIQEINVTLDVCIGVCVYPHHGRQPDELLRRAAVAKNDAQINQNHIRFYQNGREARHVRQLAILGDLRRAANENELSLFLQPKISLTDGTVCGAEALLRWNHPELGAIEPSEFVPLAEHAGNVHILTEWVLRKTLKQCRQWRDQGIGIPVAVNLSARDLLNEKLPELISDILTENGLDASCLILEITEEALVRDMDRAVKVLNQLREMGSHTSLDDFGTGYSSMSHLHRLPLDELKIDRSFVMNLPDDEISAAIVKSTIELAHNLNLEVVAEGVETTAALRWLRKNGCERAQGFYLSKPMPIGKLRDFLDTWGEADQHQNDTLIQRIRLTTDF